jgi:soluble lytic murein transglycosylase-like protein
LKNKGLRVGRTAVTFLAYFLLAGLLPIGLLPLPSGGSRAWSDIYRYQDDRGVVHFTNLPTDGRYRFFMKEKPQKLGKPLYEKNRKVYDDVIRQAAARSGVDPYLVKAVIQVESAYDPQAVSIKGARGLMQIMPETGKRLGLVDPFHPEQNITAGVRLLRMLLDKYEGELPLALAAYNAGETAVDRHRGIPPFPETQGYVRKVLAVYHASPSRR